MELDPIFDLGPKVLEFEKNVSKLKSKQDSNLHQENLKK
jgi:hypothetical protein